MSENTLTVLVRELGKLLAPLERATRSAEAFDTLLMRIGFRTDSLPQPVADLGAGASTLITELERILAGDESDTVVENLRRAITDLFNGIDGIVSAPDAVFPPELLAAGFKTDFAPALVQYLLGEYLVSQQREAAFLLRALGVLRTRYQPGDGGARAPVVRFNFDFSDLPRLLDDPSLVFRNAYGWGTDQPDFETLLRQIDNLCMALHLETRRDRLPETTANVLEGGIEQPLAPTRYATRVVFFERERTPGRLSADLGFFALPGSPGHKPGLAILPRFNGVLDFRMQLGSDIAVTIAAGFDLQGGVGLILRPDEPLDVLLGVESGSAPTRAEGNIRVRAEYANANHEPRILLGSPGAGRLEVRSISGTGGLYLDPRGSELFAEIELQGGKVVIELGQGDSFLRQVMPSGGLSADLDLAVGISTLRGVYFRGGAGLELAIPAHVALGPVELDSLRIGMMPRDGKIPIEIGTNVKVALGPLQALVENLGLKAEFAFPGAGGNLGPIDLDLGFKPPTGIGLSVDAGGFKGGGFIRFEPDAGRYAGALELSFQNLITLKALALLNTTFPDGHEGFSLLIVISAEFSPIQLGFGFTLNGVGGLLGLNRTFELDVLRTGIKTGALSSVLFPRDLVANAARIFRDLEAIFPAAEGRFVFGPMAKLGWGTPTLITAELGLILEVPSPVRVALLGVVRCILPDEQAALLKLQINFLGAWEEDKKLISFDASLFDSRLLSYPLSGDMALRISYGDDAQFLLSVGGFHPAYRPPPLALPELARIAINLTSGNNPRLSLEAYFAITSNTVQVGARLELLVKAWKFNVHGLLGFDALFQFSPFYFIVSIHGAVAVRLGNEVLFGIEISVSLEGPTPWKALGRASFRILFFSVSANFSLTWGEEQDTALPNLPLLPLLATALRDPRNWQAILPSRMRALVTLRERAEGEAIGVEPAGSVRVTQKVAPLDTPLAKVGHQKPSDGSVFTLRSVRAGTSDLAREPVSEQFAPAQFFALEDADKLSRKSFELMPAGARLSALGTSLDSSRVTRRKVCYEQKIIDTRQRFLRLSVKVFELSHRFDVLLSGNAIAKSPLGLRNVKQRAFESTKVKVSSEGFSVVGADDLMLHDAGSRFENEASAHAHLAQLARTQPRLREQLQVVPNYLVQTP